MNNDPIGAITFLFYKYLSVEIRRGPAVPMTEAAADRDVYARHHDDVTTLGNIRQCCATF